MYLKLLTSIILAGGVLLLIADLASGTPTSLRGSVSVAGSVLIAGALIARAIESKK